MNAYKVFTVSDQLLSRIAPARVVLLGYLFYVLIGWVLLSLPWSSTAALPQLDHLFTSMSAVSTTGLATVTVSEVYTFPGQLIILLLIQLGGLGYMTLSSFVVLSASQSLTPFRESMTKSTFALPEGFNIPLFIKHVIIFSLIVETLGAFILSGLFYAKGVENPVWQGIFHSISAYCTAGFSLFANSIVTAPRKVIQS